MFKHLFMSARISSCKKLVNILSFGFFGLIIVLSVSIMGDSTVLGTRDGDNSAKFNIDVTFVDTSVRGPNLIDLYIEEYPRYSINNLDLNDAMYDNDPTTPDGEYTVRISMPQGLIENGDRFHVCIEDIEGYLGTKCFRLTNGLEKKPEEITINI